VNHNLKKFYKKKKKKKKKKTATRRFFNPNNTLKIKSNQINTKTQNTLKSRCFFFEMRYKKGGFSLIKASGKKPNKSHHHPRIHCHFRHFLWRRCFRKARSIVKIRRFRVISAGICRIFARIRRNFARIRRILSHFRHFFSLFFFFFDSKRWDLIELIDWFLIQERWVFAPKKVLDCISNEIFLELRLV
jgi:hypothetical protein